MTVTLHYCKTCGFRPHAERIAAALERELGLESRFREGFWGTFRIEHGDEPVFDRRRTRGLWGRLGFGRTPTSDEIVALFRERLPTAAANMAEPSTH